MSGIALYSNLAWVLAEQKLTVPRLQRRLRSVGARVNIKTLYRWTRPMPLERIDSRVTAAICSTCHVKPGDLLVLDLPKPKLQTMDKVSQARLDRLMDKNPARQSRNQTRNGSLQRWGLITNSGLSR